MKKFNVLNKNTYNELIEHYFISNEKIPVIKQGNNILPGKGEDFKCPFGLDDYQIIDGTRDFINNNTNGTIISINGTDTNNTNSNSFSLKDIYLNLFFLIVFILILIE